MSEKQEIMKNIEQFRNKPSEFLEWLRKEPKEPEKEWKELKPQIAPTCRYCGEVAQITDEGIFCTEEGRQLTEEEVVKPDIDEDTVVQVNAIARKGARLFLKASENSGEVYEHLIKSKKQGDEEWQEMLEAIGSEAPEIGREINGLNIPPFMAGWCVLNVKFLYEHYDEL